MIPPDIRAVVADAVADALVRAGIAPEEAVRQDADSALSDNQPRTPDAEGTKKMRRINGPYSHGRQWRVVEVDFATKARTYHTFETRSEANAAKLRLDREAYLEGGATVAQAIGAYGDHQAAKGNKPLSIAHTRYRLTMILDGVKSRSIRSLTKADLQQGLTHLDGQAGDSRLGAAAELRSFLRWAREKGDIRTDLASTVKIAARRRTTPKDVPRLDEARAFLRAAFEAVAEGDAAAVAVAMLPLLGVRAGEVIDRTVRDLDDGGRLLWINNGKTSKATRRLRVPAQLQTPLLRLAAGRPPDARLFDQAGRHWLTYHCKKVCRRAGIRVWRPHAWRRFHITMAVEAGNTAASVTAAVGHESFTTTTTSYAAPSAVASAQQDRVAWELGPLPGSQESPTVSQPSP